MKIFLHSYSVYSCHLFLITSPSVRSMPFLSFIELIFAWNIPMVSLIFLKRSLLTHSFVFLYFFALITDEGFLSLLAILWNSAFRCLYLSVSPLLLDSILFTAICKASSESRFAFLHFFFLGMVLNSVWHTMSWTSVHCYSGTLSIRSSPLNLFLTSTV